MTEYLKPQDRIVADLVKNLDEANREAFEEKSAVFQYDAGMTRGHAECLALLSIIQRHGWRPSSTK